MKACCCCSVAQSCLTLWDPMNCSISRFPVLHYLPEFAQTHVHQVSDAIQLSHPLLSSSPALNLSQHQKESESDVTQSCLTLCDPMACSPPGSSIHGIFQARILEWIAIFFARGFFRPRDQTQVFHIAGRLFTHWARRESQHQGLYQWLVLRIRWPKYCSFSFSTSPSNEYSGLISFRIDWFDLLSVQGTLKRVLKTSTCLWTNISMVLSWRT